VSRTRRVILPLLACLVLLAGCSSLSGTGDKGFVTGDGRPAEIAVEDRGDPIELTGEGLDGEALDLADFRGKVTVVNVWGSWCGPCRAEMPDLVEAAKATEEIARFVGINVRDPAPANASSFMRSFGGTWPSFYSEAGRELLAFRKAVPPNAIPSTLVLDAEGRVARAVIGPVPTALTLVGLIEDVAAEGTSEGTDG
jgi:thiol-disulfide isomerase/thioredoxin